MNKMFAFWKQEQFPFLLGAEVVRMHPNGSVSVRGYREVVNPIRLLPLKEGRQLSIKLSEMAAARRQAEKALEKEWEEKAKELVNF